MAPRSSQHRPSPLNSKRLDELALRYVARFATTRSKLRAYLSHKVREKGWGEEREPDLDGIVLKLTDLGYIDEPAYALAKSRQLVRKGYGGGRLDDALKRSGIDEDAGKDARAFASKQALDAALRFARKRKIGPFASSAFQKKDRDKAIAAMVRAGHPFQLALKIASLEPGSNVAEDEFPDDFLADH